MMKMIMMMMMMMMVVMMMENQIVLMFGIIQFGDCLKLSSIHSPLSKWRLEVPLPIHTIYH